MYESLAINPAHLEATHGDPLVAFEFTVGIRNYHEAGNIHSMRRTDDPGGRRQAAQAGCVLMRPVRPAR